MLGIELTNRTQRHIVGIILLILVAIIWVASSELSKYIFQEKYPKPFFSTYLKNSMFMLYLFGFLLFKQWRDKCKKPRYELTSNSGSSDEEQTLVSILNLLYYSINKPFNSIILLETRKYSYN